MCPEQVQAKNSSVLEPRRCDLKDLMKHTVKVTPGDFADGGGRGRGHLW